MACDCAEAIDRLWEYIDGELTESDGAPLAEHLADCRHCFLIFSLDRAFLARLSRAGRACTAPAPLLLRVRARLESARLH